MNQTMTKLRGLSASEHTLLMRVLFGQSLPVSVTIDKGGAESGSADVCFLDADLNKSQRDAIRFALSSKEVALIHGPPGVSLLISLTMSVISNLGRLARHLRW